VTAAARPRRVLIIVENLPVPFDTRVWNEATALAAQGYAVSVICPVAEGFEKRFETIDGIVIYRYPLPRVPDRELVEMLNTADVCVSPDEVNEMNDKSTMNKVMEYMALGKPIVQFETTEGRFSAQSAALYARPNDARDLAAKVLGLLADPARRRAMGGVGLERIRTELAWPHQELLAAYDAAFSGRP
jgi:glycosyltransferase involved in cell wall biosynthesis